MNNLDAKYRVKGLLLLVLYLVTLVVGVSHTHECYDETLVCQDCLHHVEHNAHVSQASVLDSDCMLCMIIHTSYITPEALYLSAVVFLTTPFVAFTTCKVARRTFLLPSLRAPPVIC